VLQESSTLGKNTHQLAYKLAYLSRSHTETCSNIV